MTTDHRTSRIFLYCLTLLASVAIAVGQPLEAQTDALPSWNDGPAKSRIVEFVKAVSEPGSKDFVPAAERIAVFDNDGTLWSEQPAYFQLLPEVDFVDDKAGKPVGIQKFIGRRPIAAFGNSDGGFEMLEWTTAGPGARLGLIVHHDDREREFAYDRNSPVGRLARGLVETGARGWTVVSMKNDWRAVYPQR